MEVERVEAVLAVFRSSGEGRSCNGAGGQTARLPCTQPRVLYGLVARCRCSAEVEAAS